MVVVRVLGGGHDGCGDDGGYGDGGDHGLVLVIVMVFGKVTQKYIQLNCST